MTAATPQEPFKLAFIGGSYRSAVGYTHYIASQMDHRWKVEAGCFSQHEDVNRETARLWGIDDRRLHADWQTLLQQERSQVDALVVLTPTPSHAEIVSRALEMGYAVICEKALATNFQEIERIRLALQQGQGFLAVTYNYSGYPMLRELRELIARGKLGRILHVQVEMPQEGFVRLNADGSKPQPQAWRLQDGKIPTISLDLGVHVHHLVHYLTGQSPRKVVADQDSYGWFDQVVDNISAMLRYDDGMQCQMWYSKSALGHRNGLRIRVYGDQASAEWFQMTPEELQLSRVDGTRQIIDRAAPVEVAGDARYGRFKAGHPAGFIEAFANLYRDIADCLQGFRRNGQFVSEHVYGIDHSAEGIRLLEAVAESAQTQRWVQL